MATTGTYAFDPAIAEIIDESSERAGIDPASLGQSHLKAIFRSLRLMLNSEWSTMGIRQWMIEQASEALTINQRSFTLPVGGIDVIAAVLRRQGQDTEMAMISRNEYLTIVDKDDTGRPDRFYVDRGAALRTVWFWQASENTTDIIVYDYFRQIQDVGTSMTNTLQIPPIAHDAMCAGLAARIAQKFNKPLYQGLMLEYNGGDPINPKGKLGALRMEDRERGDIEINAQFEPRTIRR
jgi:hypothetical protein